MQNRPTNSIVFPMVADSFLRKRAINGASKCTRILAKRFPIRPGKIQQVCLENALANVYAGNDVPRHLYR
jgi:hypothetical protein